MKLSMAEFLPTGLIKLTSIPWMEEMLMILCTALVYIVTHHHLTSSDDITKKKRKQDREAAWLASSDKLRGASCREDRCEPAPAKVRGTGQARAQPQTSMEVPGVTDSRFTGVIITYKPDEGYGFIQCPELHQRFGRDVFLHKLQVGSFAVGATVSFGVFLNKSGQPQAKELRATTPQDVDALLLESIGHNNKALPRESKAAEKGSPGGQGTPQSGRSKLSASVLAKELSGQRAPGPRAAPGPEPSAKPPPGLEISPQHSSPFGTSFGQLAAGGAAGQEAFAKQPLNPYAKPFSSTAQSGSQALNPFAKQFAPPAREPRRPQPRPLQERAVLGEAPLEMAEALLAGLWRGDDGGLYSVRFTGQSGEGQPVAMATRRRPSDLPKSIPLFRDSATGTIEWKRGYSLDPGELAQNPEHATWRGGGQCLVWRRAGAEALGEAQDRDWGPAPEEGQWAGKARGEPGRAPHGWAPRCEGAWQWHEPWPARGREEGREAGERKWIPKAKAERPQPVARPQWVPKRSGAEEQQ